MNTAARFTRPIDYLLLLLSAFAVGLVFLKAPGLGDDFTYWRVAWSVQENGVEGWNPKSFHNLRWPIWGFCWAIQEVFGPGLLSYYLVPFTYLALSAMVVYALAARLLSSRTAGWAAAVAFLFHPLLDTVIFRPMPDLTEGFLIGLGVLCWLALVEAGRTRTRLLLALATGVIAAVAFSNRLTGLFIFGVLGAVAIVSVLNSERFRWRDAVLWLGVIGATALALMCVEGLIYKQITGDFFHSIHANMGAKGRRGTEEINIFTLPFRFFDSLSGRGFIGPFYLILTAVGAVFMSWKGGLRGRVIVAWAITLYLGYSCALQEFFPPRPLLRNADRFLTSLALPFSILAIAGAAGLLAYLPRQREQIRRHAVLTACIAVVLLTLASRRTYFSLGQIPQFREYITQLEDGTQIFTQHAMRSAAYLIAPEKAARLKWDTSHNILHWKESLEKRAQEADEFWFCRKLTWLSDRQGIQRDEIHSQKTLGTYFTEPEKKWKLMEVINVGEVPEFVFYRKRPAGDPVPTHVEGSFYFPELPPVPFHWKGKGGAMIERDIPIPEILRGKSLALQIEGSSNNVQAIRARVLFYNGNKRLDDISLRPYFHRTNAIDFYHIGIPDDATRAMVYLTVASQARELNLKHLYILKRE